MTADLALHRFKPVLKGLLSWVPGVQRAFYDRRAAGGTAEPAYCYGVWMKHLALLWMAGLREIPASVAEMGPGRSLGTGLAALLSGAERYAGLDAVRHASAATTEALLAPMAQLFRTRAGRPSKCWPRYDSVLDERRFPSGILTDERLERSLAPARVAGIASAVRRLDSLQQDARLRYGTWRDSGAELVGAGEADLVFSHVVLPVVEDQDRFYACCARWLKPGGWMSHHIDFTSLGVTEEWNGHLQYGEAAWRVIAGQRPFFVSRNRLSTHLALLEKHGFELVKLERGIARGGIDRSRLAPRWRNLSQDDFGCAYAFIVARKAGSG